MSGQTTPPRWTQTEVPRLRPAAPLLDRDETDAYLSAKLKSMVEPSFNVIW